MRLQIPINPPPTILVPTLGLQTRTLSLVSSVSGSSRTGAGSSDDDDDFGDSSRFGVTVPAFSESEVGDDGDDDEASFQDEGSARDFFMANLTSHKRPPLSPAPSSTTLSWTKGSR